LGFIELPFHTKIHFGKFTAQFNKKTIKNLGKIEDVTPKKFQPLFPALIFSGSAFYFCPLLIKLSARQKQERSGHMDDYPLATFDLKFKRQGIRYLCGVDEAGRGPLAGPVVAAAVILPYEPIRAINDSKKLAEKRRNFLNDLIRERAIAFGIGLASVEEIDRLNILQATFLAMQRAVRQLALPPEYILVDGRDFPSLTHELADGPIKGSPLIKGDGTSQVVAAASILAKVFRDALMRNYDREFPQYGFARHKGYGTKEHRQKIAELGPCPLHRKKFIQNILAQSRQKSLF